MDSNFAHCYAIQRREEGGNDDDQDDPGGRTSRGIIQREFNSFCKRTNQRGGDVWKATEAQIEQIYHDDYWMPYGPILPSGVDLVFFDCCVNSGPHQATLFLQRALGVAADGHIGSLTKEAMGTCNPVQIVISMSEQRKVFYTNLHKAKYIRGWLKRVADVRRDAMALVSP